MLVPLGPMLVPLGPMLVPLVHFAISFISDFIFHLVLSSVFPGLFFPFPCASWNCWRCFSVSLCSCWSGPHPPQYVSPNFSLSFPSMYAAASSVSMLACSWKGNGNGQHEYSEGEHCSGPCLCKKCMSTHGVDLVCV